MRGGTAADHGAGAVTADPEAGISVWVTVLIEYLLYRPTYRLLADLRAHGLDLAQGTVTDGMRRLAPLFAPLREALISRTGQHSR